MAILKNIFQKTLCLTVIGAMAFAIAVASPKIIVDQEAFAQQPRQVKQRPRERISPQMTPEIFKIFEAAQEAADVNDKVKARSLIDKLLSKKGLSSYEEALGHNFRGFLYFQEQNYRAAIGEYEFILKLPKLPYQFKDGITYTLVQLHMVLENFDKSLVLFHEWFQYQENPSTSSYVLAGQLYYLRGQDLEDANNLRGAISDYDQGIPFIETAIEIAQNTQGVEALESWYQLLSAMYYAKKNYTKVKDIIEIVIVKWPRPQYWVQLSAMYSELGENDKQLAVMDVAYRLGFLDKGEVKSDEKSNNKNDKKEKSRGNANIINMAQLYNYNGTPYLGAKALARAFEDGEVVKDHQKNQKALGEAWLTSREYQKSIGPLEIAARDSDDGELYLQLGFVHSTLEDWAKTTRAIQRGINKGDLKNEGQAYLYLGMAFFNLEEFKKAEDAFTKARRFESSRRTASGWLKYITSEKARLIRLADAGLR